MELNDFLNLEEQKQQEYINSLDNSSFSNFIQVVKKRNFKLAMALSSSRQSNNNTIKKENEEKLLQSSKINIYEIKDNPEQPRKHFTQEQVYDKAHSIRERGLITPITVTKKDDEFILIAGQLRLEAFKLLNSEEISKGIEDENMQYSKIDVFIKDKDYSDTDIAIDSLIENLNRADMSVIDTAIAIKKVIDETGISIRKFAPIIGKSIFYISSYMLIANAPKEILDYIEEKEFNKPTVLYLILSLDISIAEKKNLIDKYINGKINKQILANMKTAQDEKIPSIVKQKKDIKDNTFSYIFSFKKRINEEKYKNLDTETKNTVDEKLELIKTLQDEISTLIG